MNGMLVYCTANCYNPTRTHISQRLCTILPDVFTLDYSTSRNLLLCSGFLAGFAPQIVPQNIAPLAVFIPALLFIPATSYSCLPCFACHLTTETLVPPLLCALTSVPRPCCD